jgi:hypothetical protein
MNAPAGFPTQRIVNSLRGWRKHIERALRDADLMAYEDIERRVLEAELLFFDNETAFAVIDVQDYTKGRVCHILAAGGSLKGLRALQETLIPFFREIGARRLQQAGRLGWARTLPAWGWTQKRVLMEYEIEYHQDLCRRTS